MQNTDKIILDVSDSPDLQDYFSRKQPGDECSGTFKGTLDESTDGTVTLSITDVSIDGAKDDETGEPADDEYQEGDSAATTLFKSRKAKASKPSDNQDDGDE